MTDALFTPRGIVPTDEQRAIQLERHKCVVIEANAGAAKTTTLALRLAQAIERGMNPHHALVLTYTPTAVLALRQALRRIGVPASIESQVKVCTFDDFCTERLLALEGSRVPCHATAERLAPHVLSAIERVMDNPDERYREHIAVEGAGEGLIEGLLRSFTWLKGTLHLTLEASGRAITPALAEELAQDYLSLKVFRAYEHLRRGGHPDYPAFRAEHDATYDLARLLLDEDTPLEEPHPLALGVHLILLDEMHDTNRAMFTVLRHVLQRNPTAAFVGVGDRDQAIHAQAGADAAFMGSTFDREIAKAQRLPLSTSYRFGQPLAHHVGTLANKPCEATGQQATPVQLIALGPQDTEGTAMAQLIQGKVGLGPKSTRADLAILLRQPHQSVALENQLIDQGIDYQTRGFDTYLMRSEVLFVRGLLAYASQTFAAIERVETRQRILAAWLLYCGAWVQLEAFDSTDDVQARSAETDRAIKAVAMQPELYTSFIDNQVLRNAAPKARRLVETALDAIGMADTPASMDALPERLLRALKPVELAQGVLVRREDIDQVRANVEHLLNSARGYDHLASFCRGLNEREIRQHGMRGKDRVMLSSIEAAKGLEFDHVILPGLNRGEFALGGNTPDNRNLLYVALTRARRQVTILYQAGRPSQYLFDAGLLSTPARTS